jgi:hypothetical protein
VLGVVWSAQRVRSTVNLGFLYRAHYSSLKYLVSYPHEAVSPISDTLLHRKLGSAGNRAWDIWICIHRGDTKSKTHNCTFQAANVGKKQQRDCTRALNNDELYQFHRSASVTNLDFNCRASSLQICNSSFSQQEMAECRC